MPSLQSQLSKLPVAESIFLPSGEELRAGNFGIIRKPMPGFFEESDIHEILGKPLKVVRVEKGTIEDPNKPGSFMTIAEVVFIHPITNKEFQVHASYVRKVESSA